MYYTYKPIQRNLMYSENERRKVFNYLWYGEYHFTSSDLYIKGATDSIVYIQNLHQIDNPNFIQD